MLSEAREVKPFWRRVLDAIVEGLGFTVILWALLSLFDAHPTYVAHHLTDFYGWVFVAYALGSFVTKSEALNLPGTQKVDRS